MRFFSAPYFTHGNVNRAKKVVLIDRRTTKESLRTQDKIQRLTHRGLANIVAADQKRVPFEHDASTFYAAEVLYLKESNLHTASPRTSCPAWACVGLIAELAPNEGIPSRWLRAGLARAP